jgi:hypothetical protein
MGPRFMARMLARNSRRVHGPRRWSAGRGSLLACHPQMASTSVCSHAAPP